MFIEKPLAVSRAECDQLARTAALVDRVVGVNHNALFFPAFQKAGSWIREGWLGGLEHVTAWWNVPLFQLQQRHFGHWMFQSPVNILLEQAVHPLSQIVYLLGEPVSCSVVAGNRLELPSGATFIGTWTATLQCERGTATCFLSFGRSYMETALHMIGEDGVAYTDVRRNVSTLARKTRYVEQVDDLLNGLADGVGTLLGAGSNFVEYGLSFLKLRRRSDPFYRSMESSISAFYQSLQAGRRPPVPLEFGRTLVTTCEMIAQAATAQAEVV